MAGQGNVSKGCSQGFGLAFGCLAAVFVIVVVLPCMGVGSLAWFGSVVKPAPSPGPALPPAEQTPEKTAASATTAPATQPKILTGGAASVVLDHIRSIDKLAASKRLGSTIRFTDDSRREWDARMSNVLDKIESDVRDAGLGEEPQRDLLAEVERLRTAAISDSANVPASLKAKYQVIIDAEAAETRRAASLAEQEKKQKEIEQLDALYRTKQASPQNVISLDDYYQIKIGMSHARVREIIGSGGEEVSSSSVAGYSIVIVSWQNRNGSNALLTFRDGKLEVKAQSGLK